MGLDATRRRWCRIPRDRRARPGAACSSSRSPRIRRRRASPGSGGRMRRALAERNDVHLVTRLANREAILAAGLREGHDFTAIDLERLEQRVLALATRLRGGADKGWTTLMALSLPLYLAFEREVWRSLRRGYSPAAVRRRAQDHAGQPDHAELHRVKMRARRGPVRARPAERRAALATGVCRAAACRARMAVLPARRASPGPLLPRHAPAVQERSWSARSTRFGIFPSATPADASISPRTVSIRPGSRRPPPSRLAGRRRSPDQGFVRRQAGALQGLCHGDRGLGAAAQGWPRDLRHCRRWPGPAGAGGIGRQPRTSAGGSTLSAGCRRTRSRGTTGRRMSWCSHRSGSSAAAWCWRRWRWAPCPSSSSYGGPGELVNTECGVAVPIGRPSDIVAGVRAAVCRLLDEPDRRRAMAVAARRRAETLFVWRRKAEQTEEVYDWVLGQTTDEAGLPFPSRRARSSRGLATAGFPQARLC